MGGQQVVGVGRIVQVFMPEGVSRWLPGIVTTPPCGDDPEHPSVDVTVFGVSTAEPARHLLNIPEVREGERAVGHGWRWPPRS